MEPLTLLKVDGNILLTTWALSAPNRLARLLGDLVECQRWVLAGEGRPPRIFTIFKIDPRKLQALVSYSNSWYGSFKMIFLALSCFIVVSWSSPIYGQPLCMCQSASTICIAIAICSALRPPLLPGSRQLLPGT